MFLFLENVELFPLPDYWWLYTAFILFVAVMLAIDLGIFNRKAHAMTVKEAAIWSAVWVGIGLVFNIGFELYADTFRHEHGPLFEFDSLTLQFFTAYVLEYALSVDNIFVFILVFTYFGIPPEYRHRVLFYGILGAVIFRGIFIAL
ncbi:MAG: TerC family protein, partial [Acidobacteriota bacterium]